MKDVRKFGRTSISQIKMPELLGSSGKHQYPENAFMRTLIGEQ